ncbi:MAG TPA: bidirectional hydrogenase complex protein HoxE [Gemmataceae bacterium]|jgi:bidirectional [NiFe] hydrogenase diaphorase subunit
MTTLSAEMRRKKTAAAVIPPSGDPRFEQLEATMKRHQYRQDALIEVLHAAQKLFGFLEPPLLHFVAQQLKLPPSRVYGVATFYHLFTLKPRGRHTCIVCTGTACYVKGANNLLSAIREAAGIEPGQTTPDGELTLRTVRCLEPCGIAPVAVLDGTVHGHETPATLLAQVKGWLSRGTIGSA